MRSPPVRMAAVQELARGWKEDAETLPLLRNAHAPIKTIVRRAAVQELARGWKEDAETLPMLKERARSDADAMCGVRRCRSWRGAGRRMPRPSRG